MINIGCRYAGHVKRRVGGAYEEVHPEKTKADLFAERLIFAKAPQHQSLLARLARHMRAK
jgi:hypothetical protein